MRKIANIFFPETKHKNQFIFSARERLDISMQKVADAIDVPWSYIDKLENNKIWECIRLGRAVRLVNFLNKELGTNYTLDDAFIKQRSINELEE